MQLFDSTLTNQSTSQAPGSRRARNRHHRRHRRSSSSSRARAAGIVRRLPIIIIVIATAYVAVPHHHYLSIARPHHLPPSHLRSPSFIASSSPHSSPARHHPFAIVAHHQSPIASSPARPSPIAFIRIATAHRSSIAISLGRLIVIAPSPLHLLHCHQACRIYHTTYRHRRRRIAPIRIAYASIIYCCHCV